MVAPRGFPVAIRPPPCPVSREVPKTPSLAAEALRAVEKGFFWGQRGSSGVQHQPWGWRPHPPTKQLRKGLSCPKLPRLPEIPPPELGSSRLTECLPRQEAAGSRPGGTLPAVMDARGAAVPPCSWLTSTSSSVASFMSFSSS